MNDVSLIGYADLGSQTGQAFTELAKGLQKHHLLNQVFCRGVEEESLPKGSVSKPIPLTRTLPKAMTGVGRYVTSSFPNRHFSEALFDYYTSKSITENSDIHIHHTPGYQRSLNKAKKNECPVVVKATTEYTPIRHSRLAREYEKWGVQQTTYNKARIEKRKETVRNSEHIIALSTFVRDSLIKGGISPEKISVSNLGINFDDYTSKNKEPDRFTVLFVGSISISKGIPYLLRAWKKNGWENDQTARLILAGPIASDVSDRIADAGIQNLETPGYVDPRNYYPKTSVFCFPSLSEGFEKVTLEAMASGLPIVTTSNTGAPDVITDGSEGYIIEPANGEAIADKLQMLRSNPALRREMAQSALETAYSQPWDNHVNDIVDILKSELV